MYGNPSNNLNNKLTPEHTGQGSQDSKNLPPTPKILLSCNFWKKIHRLYKWPIFKSITSISI